MVDFTSEYLSQSDAGAVFPHVASLPRESLRQICSGKGDGCRRSRRHGGSVWRAASTAAIATFYETLVMMASGGLIAAAGFAMAPGTHQVGFTLPPWGHVELPPVRRRCPERIGNWLGLSDPRCAVCVRTISRACQCPSPAWDLRQCRDLPGRFWAKVCSWSSGGWVFLDEPACGRAHVRSRQMGFVDGCQSGTGRDRQCSVRPLPASWSRCSPGDWVSARVC